MALEDISTALRERFEALKPAALSGSLSGSAGFDPVNIGIFHDNFRKLTRQFDLAGPDMFRVRDFFVPGLGDNPDVPVRLYEPYGMVESGNPENGAATSGAAAAVGPTMLYIHGGGFVTCDLDSHDGICRRLASGANMRLLSVDYRLAPAHPFPSANEDCAAVVEWLLAGRGHDRGIDHTRLAIGGDSAGGTLAAYLVQQNPKAFRAQVLFYPLLQLIEHKPESPGVQDMLGIGTLALKFIDEHYVAGADCHDPRLSPLLTDELAGLPPTYILTCGLDPLRFEGQAYADKLRAAGVRVATHYEKAMPHGYLNFARAFPKARKLPLEAAEFVRRQFL